MVVSNRYRSRFIPNWSGYSLRSCASLKQPIPLNRKPAQVSKKVSIDMLSDPPQQQPSQGAKMSASEFERLCEQELPVSQFLDMRVIQCNLFAAR